LFDRATQNMSGTHEKRQCAKAGHGKNSSTRRHAFAALTFVLFAAGLGGCGGDDKTSTQASTPAKAAPALISQDELKAYAKSLDHPLYWAGPRSNFGYELTKTADGSSYVRYLPNGVAAGDPRPIFLTIGTYPRDNAFGIVQQSAAAKGAQSVSLPGGGIGVPSPRSPKSVYLSYPKSPVLVEVFSTDAARSLQLVKRQAVVPIQ